PWIARSLALSQGNEGGKSGCSGLLCVHRPWHPLGVSHTVLGEVERITYENEETGFRVIRLGKLSGIEGFRTITAVGVMQPSGPGTRVRVAGKLEHDQRHGERLRVESLI